MEMKREIVKMYLKKELKQRNVSKEEKKLLKETLLYLETKEQKEKDEWQQFLARMQKKKETWRQIYPVEGLVYDVRVYEANDSCSFGLNVEAGHYASWLFKVNVMSYAQRKIMFHSIHEALDELELKSFDEAEELIEQFLASDDFKEYVDEVKKHSS